MEADTYILWPCLLARLVMIDHTKPYYSGVEVYIGHTGFAHGGSGFMVPQPAMPGDCVLGKAFADVGVNLTGAWPITQGDYPGIVPYIAPHGRPMHPLDTRIWCSPTVSHHHMQPDMI
ncbi:hypothetical protein E4T42_03921 [Aureobasidium subglaciale]|nr:hypothetical protein E4T42_03921 [Aureobasidium subglaciale]